jgi:hypothetical protein
MRRAPLALFVDDPCPLVHVYRYHKEHVHGEAPVTRDGRPLRDEIPNEFLDSFCDVVAEMGIRGKFSIVPAPAWRGDLQHGINGDLRATRWWIDRALQRLGGTFDFCPEGITHDLTVDLGSGTLLPVGESVWSQSQDRSTLTPYLAWQLRALQKAGIDATGITSPWVFGQSVEREYIAAIVAAQREVFGRGKSWYFLHMLQGKPSSRPWVAYQDGQSTLVSIPTVTDDVFWKTIDSPRQDPRYPAEIADELLSEDGRTGQIRKVLDAGGWPVILTHWQSLYSNGLLTGLAALHEVGRRVRARLADTCEWMNSSRIAELAIEAGWARPSYLPPLEPG